MAPSWPGNAPSPPWSSAATWTVIIKEALANGRLVANGPWTAALGARPDVTALAAAVVQPWADVVLSGAVTVEQVESNLAARSAQDVDLDRLATLGMDARTYWGQRAAMTWS
jgi:aryl-alcohol dehydrogenase-like predicted oxidoreductase